MNIKLSYKHLGPGGENEKYLIKDISFSSNKMTITRANIKINNNGEEIADTEEITIPTQPEASKVSNALTVTINSGTTTTGTSTNKWVFDGSAAKTIDLTPTKLGITFGTATDNYTPLSIKNGTATAVTKNIYTDAFDACTSSAAGKMGLVPAPEANKTRAVLTGAGEWNVNYAYGTSTTPTWATVPTTGGQAVTAGLGIKIQGTLISTNSYVCTEGEFANLSAAQVNSYDVIYIV